MKLNYVENCFHLFFATHALIYIMHVWCEHTPTLIIIRFNLRVNANSRPGALAFPFSVPFLLSFSHLLILLSISFSITRWVRVFITATITFAKANQNTSSSIFVAEIFMIVKNPKMRMKLWLSSKFVASNKNVLTFRMIKIKWSKLRRVLLSL